MAFSNFNREYANKTRSYVRKQAIELKEQMAITLGSIKSGRGASSEETLLAGLEIMFSKSSPNSHTTLNPIASTPETSFSRDIPEEWDKMHVGLAFSGFSVENEDFHSDDINAGKIWDTKKGKIDRRMRVYKKLHNFFAIGSGNGQIAVVGAFTAPLMTLTNDNTARGRSKGNIRLQVTMNTANPIVYEARDTTGALVRKFYLTSKVGTTQANVTLLASSATNGTGTPAAGNIIVHNGYYNKVPVGFGYFFSSATRMLQGVSTGDYPFLNATELDALNAPVTAVLFRSAKNRLNVMANDKGKEKRLICRTTEGNYQTLAAAGYFTANGGRRYNAEDGKADTTYGMPAKYVDGDTDFFVDEDYEDAYMDLHQSGDFFNYQQCELTEVTNGETHWIGTEQFGSTQTYQNWRESRNMAWDARGDDGKGTGSRGSLITIRNIQLPSETQVSVGANLWN